ASVHKAHFPHKPPPEATGEMAVVWWGGNFVEKKCYLRIVSAAQPLHVNAATRLLWNMAPGPCGFREHPTIIPWPGKARPEVAHFVSHQEQGVPVTICAVGKPPSVLHRICPKSAAHLRHTM